MKTIVLFVLFAPLLIGILAGRTAKSDSNLALSITMIGFVLLLMLYIVFVDKDSEKKRTDAPSPSFNCMNDDHAIYDRHERTEERTVCNEARGCNPALECSY